MHRVRGVADLRWYSKNISVGCCWDDFLLNEGLGTTRIQHADDFYKHNHLNVPTVNLLGLVELGQQLRWRV